MVSQNESVDKMLIKREEFAHNWGNKMGITLKGKILSAV
jgi:hypothetical protein